MKLKIISVFIAIFSWVSCLSEPTESPVKTIPSLATHPAPSSTSTQTAEGLNTNNVLLDYAFSTDGNTLAIYSNRGIYFYNLPSMNKTFFLEFEDNNYSSIRSAAIAFSPDNKQVAISGKFSDSPISIWNIESKKPTKHIYSLPNGYYVTEIEFSPNGQSIMVRNTYPMSMHCEAPEDKVALYDVIEGKELFEIDKCVIYPPIQFRFTTDDRIFLYYGSMSPAYSVYFIDSNTGQIISQENLDWNNNGNFYGISPDGNIYLVEKVEDEKRITYILDSKTKEALDNIAGKVIFLHKENDFVVSSYNPNPQWSFWEDGKFKCTYDGVQLSPEIKTSANGEVFAVMRSYTELQIWKVSTCKMIGELQFDE